MRLRQNISVRSRFGVHALACLVLNAQGTLNLNAEHARNLIFT